MHYIGCVRLKSELKVIYKQIEKTFKRANFAQNKMGFSGEGASWLCDNFYIIDSEYRSLLTAFDEIEKMPVEDGRIRIYIYAKEFVDLQVPIRAKSVKEYLSQIQNNLEISELYSFNLFLKYCILERLSVVCKRMNENNDEKSFCNSKAYINSLEYCIKGLRESGNYDFEKIADSVSDIEKILLSDPSGAYKLLSATTKRRYRLKISKDSRKFKISEKEYAENLIAYAKEGENEQSRHVGYKLFANKKPPLRFLYFVYVIAFSVLFTAMFYPIMSYWCLLILPAAYELGKVGADTFGGKLCTPSLLFSLEYEKLPESCKTLTVATVLLSKENDEIFDNIEDFYLSNKDENAYFGVLADLPESDDMTKSGDEEIINHSIGRIEALNLKYGGNFCIFIRKRKYSISENKYMGWERKRGAVVELVRFLNKGNSGGVEFYGDEACTKDIKYVVTLDMDTLLSGGDVKRLVGYMSHPLNRPVVDRERKIVTSGYGIMQPRMSPVLASLSKSPFSFLISGGGGLDIYQNARYDSYQELFSEGIFCGKGIFDVEAFNMTLDNAFPESIVLSHDILEGARLRTALICDMSLYDNVPTSALSYFKRNHRWVRGDIQALLFAGRTVKDANGNKIKNPINALSKYKIYDSVRRDLLPVFSVISIIVSAFLSPKAAIGLLTGSLSYAFMPITYGFFSVVFSSRASLLMRRFYSRAAVGIYRAALRVFFELCSLFYSATVALSATCRSIYRVNFSHKNTLEWTTAAETDKIKNNFLLCISNGLPSAVAGSALVFFSNSFLPSVFGLLWVIFPLFIYFTGKVKTNQKEVSPKIIQKFKAWSKDIWSFYSKYVNSYTNFLPPDNLSVSPKKEAAMRTSPTNIGFYLISVLGARDFEFIDTKTMYLCIKNTIESIEKLPKWNGHLYNWYNIEKNTVLGKAYVSTVDSGNLCALLVALKEGILEYAPEDYKITELAKRIEKLYTQADFSVLYNDERNLFYLGYDDENKTYDKTCYDLLMSEARLTSYFAVASGQVPVKHWFSLSRQLVISGLHIGLASWTGTAFEYFMPALLLPTYENSITDEALRHCANMQRRKNVNGIWGHSESGYYAFDGDMNYQYKAFGVGALALKNDVDKEFVISPYSSFLIAQKALKTSYKNLIILRNRGFYGNYGFYEAVDFTQKRVGFGYGIVQSYMAHHIGMSLCASVNICLNGKMTKRFMHCPEMRSARALLCEAIPSDAVVSKNKYKLPPPERKERICRDIMRTTSFNGTRKTAVISNNRTGIIADSKGYISIFDANNQVNLAETGVRFFCTVGGERKELFFDESTVFEYSHSFARYRFYKEGIKATLEISVSGKSSLVAMSLTLESTEKCENFIMYYEPMGRPLAEYEAHPAYLGLFTEGKALKNGVLISVKNRGKNSGSEYICTLCSENLISVNTKKDEIFHNGFSSESLINSDINKNYGSDGVLLYPMCAIVCEASNEKTNKYGADFVIGILDSKKEVIDLCESEIKNLSINGIEEVKNSLYNINLTAMEISCLGEKDEKLYERIKNAIVKKEKNNYQGNVQGLWKFGISGDLPLIVCKYDGTDIEKVSSLLKIHRLLSIKHLRFNPVILCDEDDNYRKENKRELAKLAETMGSFHLIGVKMGIFFIDNSEISDFDRENIYACANADIDKNENVEDRCSKNTIIKNVDTVGKEENEYAVLKEVYGGYFTDKGFVIDKSIPHVAWSFVMASACFGTIVCDRSFGYTYVMNSQMGMLTKKDTDLLRCKHGERIYLSCCGNLYDLASCSTSVYFGMEGAKYYGKIGKTSYKVEVGIADKDFIKSYKISLKNAPIGESILFYVDALMGERGGNVAFEKDGKLYTFYKKGGYLSKYKGFFYMEGSSLGEEMNCLKSNIISNDFTLCAYIGAYRSKKQQNRLEQMCDGRTFLKDISYLLPEKQLKSGYTGIDEFANFWLPYQNLVCRMSARSGHYQCSGAYGFRDQLQDASNLPDNCLQILKQHIVRCCAHQFEKGDVLHWWHKTPNGIFGIRTKCSDDRLWLIYAVETYIEKTGDMNILNLQIPYVCGLELAEDESEKCMFVTKSQNRAPLYKHLLSAIDLSLKTGEHGLPLIGSCDWNDSMNCVGNEGKGESVWLGFFIVILLKKFISICEAVNDIENAKRYSATYKEMSRVLKRDCYEYGQYLRAYYDSGKAIGSKLSKECKTDILTQSFAVFSKLERDERLENILDSIESLWDAEIGVLRLLKPSFEHEGDEYTGYIRDYPKGVRENGGQYTHAAMWGAMALYEGGRKNEARKMIIKMCPGERCSEKSEGERYALEPYVVAGDVYSEAHREGRGGWSWYTGAAGWMLKTIEKIFEKDIDKDKTV